MTPDELKASAIWWNGPEFLKYPEEEWPENKIPDKLDFLEAEGVEEDWEDPVRTQVVGAVTIAKERRGINIFSNKFSSLGDWAYHTARHAQSFRSCDCVSVDGFFKTIFVGSEVAKRFTCGSDKVAAIIFKGL